MAFAERQTGLLEGCCPTTRRTGDLNETTDPRWGAPRRRSARRGFPAPDPERLARDALIQCHPTPGKSRSGRHDTHYCKRTCRTLASGRGVASQASRRRPSDTGHSTQSGVQRRANMPLVQVKVIKGVFDSSQKQEMISLLPMRPWSNIEGEALCGASPGSRSTKSKAVTGVSAAMRSRPNTSRTFSKGASSHPIAGRITGISGQELSTWSDTSSRRPRSLSGPSPWGTSSSGLMGNPSVTAECLHQRRSFLIPTSGQYRWAGRHGEPRRAKSVDWASLAGPIWENTQI